MGGIQAALAILNLAIPNIVNLVLAIKNSKTGTATVTVILDEADAQFATNQQQVAAWFAAHPAQTPPATTASPAVPPAA